MNTQHVRTDNAEPGPGQHYRTDVGELRKPHRTDEGFVMLEGVAALPGVYPYRHTDGTIVRELIDAEELSRADSLATLGRKPVTRQHPREGLVTPKTAAADMAGVVGDSVVVGAGGYVQITVTLHRADAIADIDRGVRQLSCGYLCEIDPTPGVWRDGAGVEHPYDQRQINRRYNHVALLDRGRHGPAASLRVDGAVTVAEQSTGESPDKTAAGAATKATEPDMKFKIRIDGETYEIEAANAEEALRVQARLQAQADAEKERDTLKGRVDSLEAELAKLKDEAKVRQDAAPSADVIRQRLGLVLLAEKHGVKREDAIDLDAGELRKRIVAKAYPGLKLDGATDGYLDGILATIEAQSTSAPARTAGQSVAPGQPAQRADEADSPLQLAVKKRDEALTNAWRPQRSA
jgi:uncharacterized protein